MTVRRKPLYGTKFEYVLCKFEEIPRLRWRRAEVIPPEFFELSSDDEPREFLGIVGHGSPELLPSGKPPDPREKLC